MIRPLRADEADQLRELRLRALRTSPEAFASRFEDFRERPAEFWDEWSRRAASGADEVTLVAIDGGRWLGMVGARLLDDRPGSAWLERLWVDPAARGGGLGAELIEAVADWSRGRGAVRLELSVTENNAAAAALYERCGFSPTGRRRPLPADPARTEVFLARAL